MLSNIFQFGPDFYLIAIPAVLLTGLSKGGFASGLGMLGTPLIALVISPVQAAAILLPVLIVMDIIGLISYRGLVNWQIIRSMFPAAVVGIGIGWYTAHMVSDDWTRIIVGAIALLFAVNQMAKDYLKHSATSPNMFLGAFWGMFSGFTSFISHAGGPPYQAYTVPLKLDKTIYTGTSVVFFASINAVKVVPYFFLGQFTGQNLGISLSLVPVAVIGVLCGVWLVRRVSQEFFYKVTYVTMFAIGIKLIWDGKAALSFMS